MNKQYLIALALACTTIMLSGCGGEKLPEAYSIGEDSLPSLTAAVSLEDDLQCSEEESEDGTTSYCYTGLSSPVQAVTDYRTALETDYDCVSLSAEGTRLSEDAELSDEGELILAKEGSSGSGLFQLDLTWDATSCTVTPSFDENATLPEEPSSMTLDEVVSYFQSLSPASLGLTGTSMSDYEILCEEGLVLLDGSPCFCLDIYQSDNDSYRGSYLFSPATYEIYQLDRSTKTVQPLSPQETLSPQE